MNPCNCDWCKVRELGLIHPIQVAFIEGSVENLFVKIYFEKYQNSPKFVPDLFKMYEYELYAKSYKNKNVSLDEIAKDFVNELSDIISRKLDYAGYMAKVIKKQEDKQRAIEQSPNWVI